MEHTKKVTHKRQFLSWTDSTPSQEYKREEKWGKYVSPRANRFIVHSDVNNPTVSSLEAFDDLLSDFRPNLFLVSGLQMMDNFPFKEGERIARLEKIKGQMGSQDFEKTRIHFEMASFVDETLLKGMLASSSTYNISCTI